MYIHLKHFQDETAIRYRTMQCIESFHKGKATFLHAAAPAVYVCQLVAIQTNITVLPLHCANIAYCVPSTMLPDKATAISWPGRHTDSLLTNLIFFVHSKSKPETHYGESSANHRKCCLHSTHGKIIWEIWELSTNSLVHLW